MGLWQNSYQQRRKWQISWVLMNSNEVIMVKSVLYFTWQTGKQINQLLHRIVMFRKLQFSHSSVTPRLYGILVWAIVYGLVSWLSTNRLGVQILSRTNIYFEIYSLLASHSALAIKLLHWQCTVAGKNRRRGRGPATWSEIRSRYYLILMNVQ